MDVFGDLGFGIFIILFCMFLFAVYVAVVICGIIGLCQKNVKRKKAMLVTTIVGNSLLVFMDVALIVEMFFGDSETELETMAVVMVLMLARLGLFVGQIINYVCHKKKLQTMTPEQVCQVTQASQSVGPRLSILFGIMIGVFDFVVAGLCMFVFFCLIAMAIGAASVVEEYMVAACIGMCVAVVGMIVSIILCVVFKKKENRRKRQIMGGM